MDGIVRPADLEARLAWVGPQAPADERAGLFGPGSVTWKVNRESALFLGAGRAALLQLAHPWVAAALAEHSTTLEDPIGRFHGTFRIVYTMLFGTAAQAFAASRWLHTLHTRIRGVLPGAAAGWSAGTPYEANQIAALTWVYATLVESAVLAYNFALPALTPAETEAYYAESKRMAALFGIPPESLPADWHGFARYNQHMWNSAELGVNDLSREMAHRILAGAGSWVRPPHWYRALTAAWMPERLRLDFILPLDSADRRALSRARRWLPRVYRLAPGPLRAVGPYHEAQARLHGRGPGALTRLSNRFWLGRGSLPFAEAAVADAP
jgi:uncharacterized protein (DUF2236 family)